MDTPIPKVSQKRSIFHELSCTNQGIVKKTNLSEASALFLSNGRIGKRSGGEEHAMRFAEYLAQKGLSVSVWTVSTFSENIPTGVKKLLYTPLPKEKNAYDSMGLLFFVYLARIAWTCVRLFRNGSDVIVYGSHLFHDTFCIPFLSRKNRFQVVYIHHLIIEQERSGFHRFVTNLLEYTALAFIRRYELTIFTGSKTVRNQLLGRYDFPSDRVILTKNGIDLNGIDAIPEQPTRYDIVFCGRIHQSKGIYDLLEIIDIIHKHRPNVSCAIVGDGPDMPQWREMIHQRGLTSNFHLLGFIGEREKIETIKSAKIFVLPSHEEGWGIVIGEAMACKRPVVVYGLADILGVWEDMPIWIPLFDTRAFARSILGLLDDTFARETLGTRGYDYTRDLRWDHILEEEYRAIDTAYEPIKPHTCQKPL